MKHEMMKRLRKKHIYYMVQFDGLDVLGRMLPNETIDKFPTDETFELNEFDQCLKYVNSLRDVKADYAFYIEDWNEEDETIEHPVQFRYFNHSFPAKEVN